MWSENGAEAEMIKDICSAQRDTQNTQECKNLYPQAYTISYWSQSWGNVNWDTLNRLPSSNTPLPEIATFDASKFLYRILLPTLTITGVFFMAFLLIRRLRRVRALARIVRSEQTTDKDGSDEMESLMVSFSLEYHYLNTLIVIQSNVWRRMDMKIRNFNIQTSKLS